MSTTDLADELSAVRAVLKDSEAERINFAPLLRDAHEANASMAREFAHLHEDRERIRGERDDLAVELAAAREEIAELRAAAAPTEVVLADGGVAVFS